MAKLKAWEDEVAAWKAYHPTPWDDATWNEYHARFLEPFNSWLDQGTGTCLLRDPAHRQVIADSFHHFDAERYLLAAYVIMPNHVHILFSPHPDHELSSIVQSWKRHTSRKINARESRTGTPLWQPDYYDRLIRSQDHYQNTLRYITNNPTNLPATDYTLFPPTA